MHTAGLARQVELARNPDRALPAEQARLVNDAVMKACDTLKEGFLNNPRQCRVDFSTLLCKGADGDNCLTKPQLQTVETYYGGVKHGRTPSSITRACSRRWAAPRGTGCTCS